jgi:hypothetical protein
LTFAEFDALLNRRIEIQRLETERALFRAGTITAAIYNVYRDSKTPTLSAFDIFPDLEAARRKSTGEQTIEEQIEILTDIFGCGPSPGQFMRTRKYWRGSGALSLSPPSAFSAPTQISVAHISKRKGEHFRHRPKRSIQFVARPHVLHSTV